MKEEDHKFISTQDKRDIIITPATEQVFKRGTVKTECIFDEFALISSSSDITSQVCYLVACSPER